MSINLFEIVSHDSNTFKVFLAEASEEAINEALIKQNATGATGFYAVARQQDSVAFQAFLAKASPEAINEALIKQTAGWTGLHIVAYHQDSVAFQAFLAKASPEAINETLIKQNAEGCTGFYKVARHQDSVAFQAFLAKASPEAINEALIKQIAGWTGLHIVARNQDSVAFQAFLAKASPEAINEASVKQTTEGLTGLHMVARNQDSVAFQAFLAKASPEAINEASVKQTATGRTGLHMVAHHQDSVAFQAFLIKASPPQISKALSREKDDAFHVEFIQKLSALDNYQHLGETALHLYARFGHEIGLNIILSKQKEPFINQLNRERETALYLAAQSGSASCCNLLLSSGASLLAFNRQAKLPIHVAQGEALDFFNHFLEKKAGMEAKILKDAFGPLNQYSSKLGFLGNQKKKLFINQMKNLIIQVLNQHVSRDEGHLSEDLRRELTAAFMHLESVAANNNLFEQLKDLSAIFTSFKIDILCASSKTAEEQLQEEEQKVLLGKSPDSSLFSKDWFFYLGKQKPKVVELQSVVGERTLSTSAMAESQLPEAASP